MQAAEFFENKAKTSLLLCANFGEGKTSVAITFPRFFYIGFRQGGLEVLRQAKNEQYRKNLVRYEELCPKSDEELKEFYLHTNRAGKIYKLMDEAKEMAKRGEIDTLIIDDFTDGVENMQKYVWTYEPLKTSDGKDDVQGMFGTLKRRMSDLFDRDILTFRKHGNIVVCVHLMRESEQTIDGTKSRAGAVDKMSTVYPDIVGSLRREVQRKFENCLYLEYRLSDKKHVAYTSKQMAFGTVILAKNAVGMAPIVENVTYEAIIKSVSK